MHRQIIELAVQLGVLFVLLLWCFTIIQPFVLIIMWGVIVAIALFPVHQKLTATFGPHHKFFRVPVGRHLNHYPGHADGAADGKPANRCPGPG